MSVNPAPPTLRLSESTLIGKRWAFGLRGRFSVTETFCFSPDGLIENYSHPNEASWKINDGILEIRRADGELMWWSAEANIDGQILSIVLRTPHESSTQFVLIDRGPRQLDHNTAVRKMGASDFLFPRDLEITALPVKGVLLIGSCLTALYNQEFKKLHPDVHFDYIVSNYAGSLPVSPPQDVSSYDFQLIQIPLRSVVTDRVIWAERLADPAFVDTILSDGYAIIDAMLSSTLSYNSSAGLLSFVSNFIVPQKSTAVSLADAGGKSDLCMIVRRFNEYLVQAVSAHKNVYLLDADAVAGSIGKRYILDDTIYFHSHNSIIHYEPSDFGPQSRIEQVPPISDLYHSKKLEFLSAIYDQMVSATRTLRQVDQVKAVIFDLDNTLWRGLAAENYRAGQEPWPKTDGWPTGIWELIHLLRARGIMVAICSKNDQSNIESLWANVVQPRFVSLEDFVTVKINWRPKAENILDICNELSIKPKSVVFVDDNPVERESVKAQLPGIRVIGSDPYSVRRVLLWSPETQIAQLTDESARRETMIRNQIVREEKRATLSREEFLQTLGSTVSFVQVQSSDAPEFPRVVELINKTNQFNTTGKRWTHAEAADFVASNGVVLAFRVKDRFADYGLVGVILAQENNIVQFVMSCRVLGMEVEKYAMAHAVSIIRRRSQSATISACLVETADNTPCRDIFISSGFNEVECVNGRHLYSLRDADACVEPKHITLVDA
jgi:FkbH-like protein